MSARFRRILVAVDASPDSLAAAEAAAELAGKLAAELVGLFVEDEELLDLVGHPAARQVDLHNRIFRPADSAEIERLLRVQAERARGALSRSAKRAQVTLTFRVVRGRVAGELLAAAPEADLVALGRVGWSRALGDRMGRTARAATARRGGSTLLLPRGARLGPPITVLFGDPAEGERALAAGAHLGQAWNTEVDLLWISSRRPEKGEGLPDDVAEMVARDGFAGRIRELPGERLARELARIGSHSQGILVLPADLARLAQPEVQEALERLRLALLFVG